MVVVAVQAPRQHHKNVTSKMYTVWQNMPHILLVFAGICFDKHQPMHFDNFGTKVTEKVSNQKKRCFLISFT